MHGFQKQKCALKTDEGEHFPHLADIGISVSGKTGNRKRSVCDLRFLDFKCGKHIFDSPVFFKIIVSGQALRHLSCENIESIGFGNGAAQVFGRIVSILARIVPVYVNEFCHRATSVQPPPSEADFFAVPAINFKNFFNFASVIRSLANKNDNIHSISDNLLNIAGLIGMP